MNFWMYILLAFLGGLFFAELRLFLMKSKIRNITESISDKFLENDAYLTYPGPTDSNKKERAKIENIVLKDIHVNLCKVINEESMHSKWEPRQR